MKNVAAVMLASLGGKEVSVENCTAILASVGCERPATTHRLSARSLRRLVTTPALPLTLLLAARLVLIVVVVVAAAAARLVVVVVVVVVTPAALALLLAARAVLLLLLVVTDPAELGIASLSFACYPALPLALAAPLIAIGTCRSSPAIRVE